MECVSHTTIPIYIFAVYLFIWLDLTRDKYFPETSTRSAVLLIFSAALIPFGALLGVGCVFV